MIINSIKSYKWQTKTKYWSSLRRTFSLWMFWSARECSTFCVWVLPLWVVSNIFATPGELFYVEKLTFIFCKLSLNVSGVCRSELYESITLSQVNFCIFVSDTFIVQDSLTECVWQSLTPLSGKLTLRLSNIEIKVISGHF